MRGHAGWLAAVMMFRFAAGVTPHGPEVDRFDAERDRIQAHLEGAERALMEHDASSLSPAQRAARARNLAELRAYRMRGVFPHNHRHAVRRPSFVDEHGTRCAMAHLIERSGRGDLVQAVARGANDAYVRDLASDPELREWLTSQGLTVAEAARIQPEYDPRTGECLDCTDWSTSGDLYDATTAIGATLGLTTIGWNLSRMRGHAPGGVASVLGIALGFAGVGAGIGGMGSSDANDRRLAAINAVVGLGSIVTGSLALARPDRFESANVSRTAAPSAMTPLLASDPERGIRVGVRAIF
jgi:hypothetical protein